VAQVGADTITKSALTHWVSAMIGGDYYEVTSQPAPSGLVSEPANYAACLAVLEPIAPSSGASKPTGAVLARKCQQLHQGVMEQALRFLIYARWSLGEAAEQGITLSDAEVQQEFAKSKAERFPKGQAELQQYLANRHWTYTDELLLVKLDALQEKVHQKLEHSLKGSKALASYGAKWIAATNCRAGFVVYRCKQYKGPDQLPGPSPAAMLQEIGQWQPATSHGFNRGTAKLPGT
jgi:hypothetical protein